MEEIKTELAAWEEALTYAFNYLDEHKWPANENFRKYAVQHNDKLYPNKSVLRHATDYLKNHYKQYAVTPSLSGGKPINDFLETKGASVFDGNKNIDFFKEIIAQYKVHLQKRGLVDEIYKWELVEKYKGRPNVDTNDFTTEIKGINFSNLVYGVGIGVIRELAQEKPEEYRACFNVLFDENLALADRVVLFNEKVTNLYRTLVPDTTRSAHHDERTIATMLTYHSPEKYTFYKDSFYQVLCKKLGEKSKPKGEKYAHYLAIVDDFIEDYIQVDQELIALVNSFMNEDTYSDPSFMILAQDILYSTLEKKNYDLKNLFDEVKSLIEGNKASPIKMLTSRVESDRENQWFKCRDNKGVITGSLAHYEVGCSHVSKDLAVALHFENRKNNKLFKEIISDKLPGHYEWFGWYGGNSIRLNSNSFRLDEDDIATKIVTLIEQADLEIGELIRNVIKAEFSKELFKKTLMEKKIIVPLNQILYGPPGTGKTYHTINKALAIIEHKSEDELEQETREALKERYQDYVVKGQIVFTTFHQSMSYEDFVEGIKPEIEEDKDGVRTVVYETKAGIFKVLCENAQVSTEKKEQPVIYQFDDAWNDLLEEIRINREDAKEDFILDILTPNRGLKVTEITDQGNLRITPMSIEGLTYTVSYTRAKKLQAAFPDLLVVKNIDKEFRAVIGGSNSTAYWAVINNLNQKIAKNKSAVEVVSTALKPHVLIIDEINRGNVSAIFGELITLIEESKRAGASEALTLTLPYSKEKFSVPSNLYIIGTMNTADRSVEALDTALRRRFAFEEMMPEPSKITTDGALAASAGILEGVDLAAVLTKINERIAILLDVDHQIGHSYLINVRDTNGLANAFNNCIVPLLKEYFYHDDEKIALVMGAGFVNVKAQTDNIQALFPLMQGLEVHSIDSKRQFELKPITSGTIISALETLLNGG